MNLQPTLQNDYLMVRPLAETDFDALYAIANNPLVWEQHPNPNRYKKEIFEIYFNGAIESKGAFIVLIKVTNEVVGCTRFYQYEPELKNIFIGYTFVGLKFWGQEHNRDVKKLLVNYAFESGLNTIQLHIGTKNIRSQMASKKLGAELIDEILIAYYGEEPQPNYIFEFNKNNWKYFL
jgi:RimJ/RimL family protein N-acetyltransferase